jgi:hypothetical protein
VSQNEKKKKRKWRPSEIETPEDEKAYEQWKWLRNYTTAKSIAFNTYYQWFRDGTLVR